MITIQKTSLGLIYQNLKSFLVVNRLPETIGYNIIYIAIGIGLVSDHPISAVQTYSSYLFVLFTAMMVSKMQASVADALHDYKIDKENPEKSYIAESVRTLGERNLYSLLVVELTVGLSLWGWLAFRTEKLSFLLMGAIVGVFGFTYSYPPRIKERGFLNHIVTTGVDVICAILPVSHLMGLIFNRGTNLLILSVLFYILGYHIAHQAADTYFDRKSGLSTFTQQIGVSESILLSGVSTITAGIFTWIAGYSIASLGLGIGGLAYVFLFYQIMGKSEKEQSLIVARWFSVSLWATYLNGVLALDLLL
ncbi:UbiA family prenyltransferase [Natrinema sp. LN54]|uniref:UbiA family prenyltransferase n=1 Tax=Natrinema sp. LN54 TaxID=3458705 RepID=UPI0040374234